MPVLPLDTCPMFGDNCRHCSLETTLRPYTKIERNPITGIYKSMGLGKTVVQLGAFCSNINKWVADMAVCPVRWMKENPPKPRPPVPKKTVTKVKQPRPKKSVVVKAKQVLSLKKRAVVTKKKMVVPLPDGQTQLWFGKRRKK